MQGRSFDLPKPTPEELSNLDQETTRDHVQAAIQRLPERYRLPVTLRFLNEMDYAGISQELELSNGALRGLLNRGVKMLKLELEPFWKKNR
jgi:RNA polymerase sigma-70 factor (ECF subfamily)